MIINFNFTPLSKGVVEVTFQCHTNPGGKLPKFLVNVAIWSIDVRQLARGTPDRCHRPLMRSTNIRSSGKKVSVRTNSKPACAASLRMRSGATLWSLPPGPRTGSGSTKTTVAPGFNAGRRFFNMAT